MTGSKSIDAVIKLQAEKDREMLISQLSSVLVKQIRDTIRAGTRHCCNCFHFNEEKELCNVYKQRPPARIIALGCKDHCSDDDIPF